MKTFSQNGVTYLAVEYIPKKRYVTFNTDDLIKIRGQGEVIGVLPLITEEQAREMVDDCAYFAKCWHKYDADHESGCHEYNFNSEYSCWTAIDSLKSRLRSLGFTNENILIIKQLT